MKTIRFTPNGQNRTPEVVEALRQIADGTTIEFAQGIYDFYMDGTYTGCFYPGCNRNGDKRVVFPLLRVKNVTILGDGAHFLFHDRVFPFVLQDCTGITMRGFSVDYAFPLCIEAHVSDADNTGFLLAMDHEYCHTNAQGNLCVSAGIEVFSSRERRFFLEGRTWHCYLACGDILFAPDNAPAPFVFCDAMEVPHGIFFRYRAGSERMPLPIGKRVLVSYDELRENDVIFLERCRDTIIEDVRIFHGPGMGIVGQCAENLTLRRYVVDPGDDGLYATTADAVLLTNFSGLVKMEDCRIDRSVDDALSIHGFYSRVDTVTDTCKAEVRMVHPSQAGTNPYFPGDTVVITDGTTYREKGKITIRRSYRRDDPALLYLETQEPLCGLLVPGDILENHARTPDVEITGCTFQNFPAIRLSSAGKMVFAHNMVSQCKALLVNDLIRYWSVSGCVRDLTILDNVFSDMDTGIRIFSERPAESDVRHRNIQVTGNTFENCRIGISSQGADELHLMENTYRNTAKEWIRDDGMDAGFD